MHYKDDRTNSETVMIKPYKYIVCTCKSILFDQENNKEAKRYSIQTQGNHDYDW